MILKYGMDQDLGQIVYEADDNSHYQAYKSYSEKTAQDIDQKIRNLVSSAYQRALKILEENKYMMEKLAELLLEKEYLSREEFEELMKDPSKIDTMVAQMSKQHADKIAAKKKEEDSKNKKSDNKEEIIILDE